MTYRDLPSFIDVGIEKCGVVVLHLCIISCLGVEFERFRPSTKECTTWLMGVVTNQGSPCDFLWHITLVTRICVLFFPVAVGTIPLNASFEIA